MFAPLYHGATARVAAIRRELGTQTTFNLLGPLTNPAGAPRQIIGVSDRSFGERLGGSLQLLGTERAWVVHGEDGLDEITIAGKTFVTEANQKELRSFEIDPADFGIERGALVNKSGGDAQENAAIIRKVLTSERRDEARALVIINAAAALYIGGLANQFPDATALAQESIDSGAAFQKLQELVDATN